jgi:hypothetical protein
MSLVSLYYSHAIAIEGRALRSEGNRPLPWSGPQTESVERMAGETATNEPSTKYALRVFVSVPSLLQAHPSIDRVLSFSSDDE